MVGSTRFQNESLMLVKNKTTANSWFFRHYDVVDGKRVHRNQRIGTVREYPLRRDAEKAVLALRAKINAEVRTPETVAQLVAHYLKHELTLERKAFATMEAHSSYLRLHILPRWVMQALSAVRTGITGKVIGFHSFRHSLATNLHSLGVDMKTAQELLRHANQRTTGDLYTHFVSDGKRAASLKQLEFLTGVETASGGSVPLRIVGEVVAT
jgi:integrase